MTKLGTWPTDRYYISWVTQRIANRAPEISHARQAPVSVLKQIANPVAQEIQTMTQQIIEERDNIFPSICNIDLLSHLYEVDLQPSLSFNYTNLSDGSVSYSTPKVFVYINNNEYEITQAYKNDIKTFAYDALPSRLEDGETIYEYSPVIPTTYISDLATLTPNDLSIKSHLYITLSDNTNWENIVGSTIYYPKIFIKGTTRKGTEVTEAVPLRYNGTFKTINQWSSVSEVFVSYLDADATISVDIFPWLGDGILDTRNLSVDTSGQEKWRFLNMGTHNWGSTFISESFTTSDFDLIRKGIDAKDIEHEIELLDENESNVTFDAFTMKPFSDYLFAISGDKFYIYNTTLPYPEAKRLSEESPDVKMDLCADKWIFARNNTATIKTRILDFKEIPVKFRWKLETPSLNKYYINANGSLSPISSDGWIDNDTWDEDLWIEKELDILLTERGTYIVSIECLYHNDETDEVTTMETKYLFYVPYITPEVTLDLPSTLSNIEDMSFDSDGKLWLESVGVIYLLNIYYDYFLADYSRNKLYLREQYSSVRIEV